MCQTQNPIDLSLIELLKGIQAITNVYSRGISWGILLTSVFNYSIVFEKKMYFYYYYTRATRERERLLNKMKLMMKKILSNY